MNLSGGRGTGCEEYVEPTSNAMVTQHAERNGTNGHSRSDGGLGDDGEPEVIVLSPTDRKVRSSN